MEKQLDLIQNRVIDFSQQRFDLFFCRRRSEDDHCGLAGLIRGDRLDASQLADLGLDGVDAMSTGNIGDAISYSSHVSFSIRYFYNLPPANQAVVIP
jgi:hypothetical protein